MNKYFAQLLIFSLLLFPSAAWAKDRQYGGYTGPSDLKASTVAEVMKAGDDSPVIMVGHIEKHLGGERYQFKDDTGTITVEIDHQDWRGLTVGPEDIVELWGEVDRDLTNRKVDVDRIVKR